MQKIEILYEDADIVAVNKPAGMVVHHDAQHKSGTVVDWLLEKYPELRHTMSKLDIDRAGIVHRLDKDTSGVLLTAKNERAYEYLKHLFQTGGITKKYFALVVGVVKNDSGVIDAPIARSRKHFEKRVVGGKQGRSREAITHYKVIERFLRNSVSKETEFPSGGGYTLLEVSPKTGRTHQIRSHLAHIGHPVACDKLYGGKLYQCPQSASWRIARQFLHAHSLAFTGPDNIKYEIDAPLARDLAGALKSLRIPPARLPHL